MPKWIDLYSREMDELGPTGMAAMLDAGRQWDLASVLTAGGVVVFPHAAPHECAHQTAAAVHACLDSGADKVLVIGVLHGWTPEMKDARERVAAGEDFTGHPLRGIHGPDMPHSRPEWQLDHSLITWRRLWHMECERRGVTGPAVCEVYPFLAGVDPTTLPHFDAVARWAEDAVIVATTEPQRASSRVSASWPRAPIPPICVTASRRAAMPATPVRSIASCAAHSTAKCST